MSDLADGKSPGCTKSLKQGRLPFKVLDEKSPLLNNVPKKRKLSSGESGQETKSAKKEIDCASDSANSTQTVATNDQEAQCATSPEGSENLKPEQCDKQVNSNSTTVTSPVNQKVTVNKKLVYPVNNLDSSIDSDASLKCVKTETERGTDCITDVTKDPPENDQEENEDCEGSACELLNTTTATVEPMSCDEESAPNDTTLNISTGSLEMEENEAKEDASELDSSVLLSGGASATPCSGNDRTTPGAKKERKPRKVDPKKSAEKEKRKEEKVRIRGEKERQLQQAREERKREKERKEVERNMAKHKKKMELEEKLKEKELKKAEALAKKNAELNEKLKAQEEKKAKKMESLQAKIDEKKRKEEEKQRKKDEKQKEEEEKQKKLEEKKKAGDEMSAKAKAAFASFFIKGSAVQQPTTAEESCGLFKPFEVTKNMKLASIIPDDIITRFDKEKLDGSFQKQDTSHLYIEELRSHERIPYKRKKQVVKEDVSDDVIILEEGKSERSSHHAKLYQFRENVRPPYYGTWTKRSKMITGRRPFALDKENFDYEVDSEEEWDEGGPGESLSGTEDEKESEDDYEVDNEFFVPHGYLSADEETDEDVGVDSAEHQARLKMREHLFEEERKQKFSVLKPRVLGCVWTSADGLGVSDHHAELARVLSSYKAILLCAMPIPTLPPHKGHSPGGENGDDHKGDSSSRQPRELPEEAMPHLIRLVHANPFNRILIMKEFMQYWTEFRQKSNNTPSGKADNADKEKDVTSSSTVNVTPEKTEEGKSAENSPGTYIYKTGFSKRLLEETLKKISYYGRGPDSNYTKCHWWVNEDVRLKYGCVDLPVPNKWSYVSRSNSDLPDSRGRKKLSKLENDVPDKVPAVDVEVSNKVGGVDSPNTILKFTCKMSPSERFEANLHHISSKNESKTTSNNLNTLFNYALKPVGPAISGSKTESDCAELKENSKDVMNTCHVENTKTPEQTRRKGSILNFTRKITPVRLDSSPRSQAPSVPPTKVSKIQETPSSIQVIEIDDSNSNK